ncbi:hypothetical protein [Arundinibacter roseus]|uniref:Uncharacterized protein n=1 Tax=Arundinibacter roseus TaxID=2070510 RepID=A0A4R4KCG5_9BACT|nr:hypothetical protein [Arundinibacter roseus]TDB64161.1 hypothetical protein EZE20_14580 [Arundinibacter roseus]
MKKILFVILMLAVFGCEKEEPIPTGEVFETSAKLVNDLAVDGCDWHFQIVQSDSIQITIVVPTRATEAKVKDALPEYGTVNSYSFTPVQLKYRPTGTKRTISCGWGQTPEVDEIEVIEVSKK